ncbi:MAG: hypothetical protein R3F23_05990 [Verrucomicrobiia bacterium]
MAKGRKGGVDGGHRSDSQGHKRDVGAHIHEKVKNGLPDLDAARVDLEVSKHESELGIAAEQVAEAGAKLREARDGGDSESIARAEQNFAAAVARQRDISLSAEGWLRDRVLTPEAMDKLQDSLTKAQAAMREAELAVGRKLPEVGEEIGAINDVPEKSDKKPRKMKAIDASEESMNRALLALDEQGITVPSHHPLVKF